MLRGKYLTTAEAAELIGKGANMIAKLCQAGRLPGAEKMGNSWIIPRESVLNYQPRMMGSTKGRVRIIAAIASNIAPSRI